MQKNKTTIDRNDLNLKWAWIRRTIGGMAAVFVNGKVITQKNSDFIDERADQIVRICNERISQERKQWEEERKKCSDKDVDYDCPCWHEGYLMGEAEAPYNKKLARVEWEAELREKIRKLPIEKKKWLDVNKGVRDWYREGINDALSLLESKERTGFEEYIDKKLKKNPTLREKVRKAEEELESKEEKCECTCHIATGTGRVDSGNTSVGCKHCKL